MFENDPMEVDVLGPWQSAKGKGKSKGKMKGKGKDKGKGKTNLGGQGGQRHGYDRRAEDKDTCRYCGKRGHWQRDCWAKQGLAQQQKGHGKGDALMRPRSVSQVVQGADLSAESKNEEIGMINEENWVMGLDSKVQNVKEHVWLDSACFDHVCPKWFADLVPITKIETTKVIRAASGHRLPLYGVRDVWLLLD